MKNAIFSSAIHLAIALASSSAFAGGGGSGWTQCYAKELGYAYSFNGYTQSLAVGKTITVFTNSPDTRKYGYYQITSMDLNSDVGVVELNHVLDAQPNASEDTDFGSMKIEYFSSSALKDIKVTITKDGSDQTSNVTCITD